MRACSDAIKTVGKEISVSLLREGLQLNEEGYKTDPLFINVRPGTRQCG